MTYTAPAFPNPSDSGRVRIFLDDFVESEASFPDDVIAFMLAEEGSPRAAAIRLARTLGKRYAAKADVTVGPLSVTYGKTADGWYDLADRLRAEAALSAAPIVGGLPTAEKPGLFDVGMHDDRTSMPVPGE